MYTGQKVRLRIKRARTDLHTEDAAAAAAQARTRLLQPRLHAQRSLRQHVQERLQLWEQPWGCDCNSYACKGSKVLSSCPVHGRPNNGISQLFGMLERMLPGVEVFAELPLLSEGKQGRALQTKQFTSSKSGDCKLDILVRSPEGLMHALEVCGNEHQTRDYTILSDHKKDDVCAQLGLPLQRLWLTRRGKPRKDWHALLKTVKDQLLM